MYSGSSTTKTIMRSIQGIELLAMIPLLLLLSIAQNDDDLLLAEAQILNNNNSTSSFSIPELFSEVKKSVVVITTDLGFGSGFIYDNDGHIITNHHVVTGGKFIDIAFVDGTVYSAKLIGSDPFTDTAVLLAEDVPKDKLAPLPLGNSTEIREGEQVVAFGSPHGYTGSMTEGIISAVGRNYPSQPSLGVTFDIPDMIQTDAAINPGNSGGPLLNMKGEVIGMNVGLFSTTGEFSGIGFAIPSNTINKVVSSLLKKGSFQHPWLGVSGIDMTSEIAKIMALEEPRGFLVVEVIPGSPAEKAGILGGDQPTFLEHGSLKDNILPGTTIALGGDLILEVDDRIVRTLDDVLIYLQREKEVGDNLKITILRDAQIQEINMTLGARPGTQDF
jgi:S1-C subfamily serine protease